MSVTMVTRLGGVWARSWLLLPAAFLAAGPALAGETRAEQAIGRLERALEVEAGMSGDLKAALLEVVRSLRAEREPVPPAPAPAPSASAPAPAAPAPRLTLSGDLRLREEANVALAGRPDQVRTRVRARLGVTYDVSEELRTGLQLRSGSPEDARSPHQTLGSVFRTHPFSLELAYLAWKPRAIAGLVATAGKFASPHAVNPVYGELVWDADVRPEGLAIGWASSVERRLRLSLLGAGYLLLERAEGSDRRDWNGQAALTAKLAGRSELQAALSLHALETRGPGADRLLAAGGGNATVDADGDGKADAFRSRFLLWNPWMAWRLASGPGGRPVTLSAELVHNSRAGIDQDTGYSLGAALGALGKPGSWQIYYSFLDVEQDAVFTPVSHDDLLRASAYRGHIAGLRLQLFEKTDVNFWMLPSRPDPDPGGLGYDWRARVDVNVRY